MSAARAPGSNSATLGRLAVRAAWIAVALFAGAFALRALVGDVFAIASGSMRPTLWDDADQPDRVLVTFGVDSEELERFDLVVLRREHEREPFVKRVAGLPGETLRILEGDLIVDGSKVGAVAAGVLEPVPLFDSDSGDPLTFLAWNTDVRSAWSLVEEQGRPVFVLDAGERPLGAFAPPLRENVLLADAYLERSGAPPRRLEGSVEVGDLALALELWVAERVDPRQDTPCGTLRATLTERGDRFHCTVQYVPGAAQISLARETGSAPNAPLALAEVKVSVERTGWQRLEFQNVDDRLSVRWNRRTVLHQAYDGNTPSAAPPGSHQVHRKPRFELSGHGKDPIRVRALGIGRDLVHTSHGTFATREPLTLGPDEVFLLGDNSSASRDSREWGPVPVADLVGRVRAIVWPWPRRRLLD